jgi:ATP-dependent Clp protease ATP-binding subunit ClpC
MFERFTDRARKVVVLAQDEARGMQHNYIGTEHILLGLLGAGGVGARALEGFDMPLDSVRAEVEAMVGKGAAPVSRRSPFTPRAKKVLEYSLREALNLSHNYIGTEHILLGLVREGDGVAAQILREHVGDLLKVRMAVLDLVPAGSDSTKGHRWRRRRLGEAIEEAAEMGELRLAEQPEELRTTPAAEASLGEAQRLAGGRAVGSHHLLLAALADPDTVVAKTLVSLGVDLGQAKEALRQADVTGTSDEQPEEAGRRQMRVRVSGEHLTIEASDEIIVGLGRTVLETLGDQAGEPGTIDGGLPVSASFSDLWLALRESLEDVRRRGAAAASPSGGEGADGEPGDPRPAKPSPAETGTAKPSTGKTGTDDA